MSSTEFRMPSLGADMDDGVVTEWLVAPGDEVRRGQIVAIVETDKSDIEVEIFEHAVIDEILVPEGERVAVGTPIARLRPADTGAQTAPTAPAATATTPASEPGAEAAPPAEPKPVPEVAPESAPMSTPTPALTSPVLRHLAEDLHVDVARIRGTGPGGRVHRDDVVAAAPRMLPSARSGPTMTPRARRLAAEHGLAAATLTATVAAGQVVTGDHVLAAVAAAPRPVPDDRHDVDPRRRAIASLMTRSWAEIPHFHVATRVSMSTVIQRLSVVNEARPVTERIVPAAVLLHAVAQVANANRQVNGWWLDGRFHQGDHVDLGVVVALRGGGIVVPTIARAEELTVDQLMVALADVVARARANRLRSSDVATASLTVTNLGDLGTDAVYGVIHPPQVALVGVGAVRDEVLALDGQAVIAPVVHTTLAGDHRALDGLVGATFLSRFAAAVETSAASIPDRRPPEEPS